MNFAAFRELFAASLVCFSIYDRYLQKVLNIYKRQMYNLYICQNPVYFLIAVTVRVVLLPIPRIAAHLQDTVLRLPA